MNILKEDLSREIEKYVDNPEATVEPNKDENAIDVSVPGDASVAMSKIEKAGYEVSQEYTQGEGDDLVTFFMVREASMETAKDLKAMTGFANAADSIEGLYVHAGRYGFERVYNVSGPDDYVLYRVPAGNKFPQARSKVSFRGGSVFFNNKKIPHKLFGLDEKNIKGKVQDIIGNDGEGLVEQLDAFGIPILY
jgi:hypothetical protein